jgi:hypothetical protein
MSLCSCVASSMLVHRDAAHRRAPQMRKRQHLRRGTERGILSSRFAGSPVAGSVLSPRFHVFENRHDCPPWTFRADSPSITAAAAQGPRPARIPRQHRSPSAPEPLCASARGRPRAPGSPGENVGAMGRRPRRARPICSAWPDGNASSRLPEKGTPWMCPRIVIRSGRVWLNTIFKACGSSDAIAVTSRAWLPARRSGPPRPREINQPAAASARSTFSSAPHVKPRAIASGAGSVLRAMAFAIPTSTSVGLTVIGTVPLEGRRVRLPRLLAAVRMAQCLKG